MTTSTSHITVNTHVGFMDCFKIDERSFEVNSDERSQLTLESLQLEFGGDVQVCPVSSENVHVSSQHTGSYFPIHANHGDCFPV